MGCPPFARRALESWRPWTVVLLLVAAGCGSDPSEVPTSAGGPSSSEAPPLSGDLGSFELSVPGENPDPFERLFSAEDLDSFEPASLAASAHVGNDPRTWYVRPDLSGDVPTIQDAIDVAGVGDEIVLAPGVYDWSNQGTGTEYGLLVVWNTRDGFSIRGEGGAEETIIDAEGQGRCLYVMGYNDNVTFEGITFQGGDATQSQFGYGYGGGVCIHLTSPTFRDCVFRNNQGDFGGGFATAGVCAALMENCSFHDNFARTIGGGVLLHNSTRAMQFQRCRIFGNYSAGQGGGIGVINVPFHFQHSEIFANLADGNGAAAYVRTASNCRFETTTMVGNTGFGEGQVRAEHFADIELDRCIVAFGSLVAAVSADPNSSLQIACSDVFGNDGGDGMGSGVVDQGGNFSLDPLFWNASASDFRLQPTSPCAAGGHPDGSDCGRVGAREPMIYAGSVSR